MERPQAKKGHNMVTKAQMVAQQNGENVPPDGAWQAGGKDFNSRKTTKGRGNIGWSTVNTEHQEMFAAIQLTPYKFLGNDPTSDYYLFFGSFSHGIQGNPDNAGYNWFSVGYYADEMTLHITCKTAGATLYNYGPDTTILQATTSFNIGANLSLDTEGKGQASLTGGFGVSFTSPEVTFAASPGNDNILWKVRLPKIGWVSPSVPANPGGASYNGYKWLPAVIFRVPKGKTCQLQINATVPWGYDYTRGIRNDTKTFSVSENYSFGPDSFDSKPLPPKPELSILETLRRGEWAHGEQLNTFQTLLGGLDFANITRDLEDSNIKDTLVAPTDGAYAKYLKDLKNAQALAGPGKETAVIQAMQKLFHIGIVPSDLRPGAETQLPSAAGGMGTMRANGGSTYFNGIPGRRIPCTDGEVLVVDTYPSV
jgi:hypothetical protein